jgi:molybdate transport system regulatory protein
MSRITRSAGKVTRKARPRAVASSNPDAVSLTLRVDLGAAGAIGPGKIRLLELIGETGSISAAGRAMGMSYRQAWLLIDSLNSLFHEPVTETLSGGVRGGGADLTPFGRTLIRTYRDIEAAAGNSVADQLASLATFLASGTPPRASKSGSRKTRS